MKLLRYLLVAIMILSGASVYAGAPTVKYQVDRNYPPYTYQSGEYLYGFDISLSTLVFDATDYDVDYSADTWDSVYKRLVKGEIDTGGIIAVTEERKNEVLFTKPLFNSYVAIYTLRDHKKISIEDLHRLRVGVGKSYYTETLLRNTIGISDYQAYEQIGDALNDLIKGNIDVIFENQQLMDNVIIARNMKGAVVPQVTDMFPREHAYAVSKKRPDLVAYMNQKLDQLKQSGVFEEIYVKFFYAHSDGYFAAQKQKTLNIALLTACILAVAAVAIKLYIDHLKNHIQKNIKILEAANEELQAKEETLVAQNEELQAKEEALLYSRNRYQMFLRQLQEGIIVAEYPALQIVEANANASRMFGYSETELLSMNLNELYPYAIDIIHSSISTLLEEGQLLPETHSFRHKDGQIVFAERTASSIDYLEHKLLIFAYRDLTQERNFQEQIRADVELAGKVQQAMLPGDYHDEKVTIKTIYQPISLISGDYYGFKWVRGGSLLNGYLLDVTGHGMATALQTAAVGALLNEELEKDHPWSEHSLTSLNTQLTAYLPEYSFAAVLAFSFDFEKKMLTCIAAGINHFIAFCQQHHGWVSLPGSFLGNSDLASFESLSVPLQRGDVFCFVTDGLMDGIVPKKTLEAFDLASLVEEMGKRADGEDIVDDCTMLCFRVDTFPCVPAVFKYAVREDREPVLQRVRQAMEALAGKRDFWLELALGEAEGNACRNGTQVHFRLNKIGNRFILRVSNDGPGFGGNSIVTRIKSTGINETLNAALWDERGRGIPIMMAAVDKVLYNRRGNEVMLIKVLPPSEKRR